MNHHIVAGTERNGYCGRCRTGGDLTTISCKDALKRNHATETEFGRRHAALMKHHPEFIK